MTENSSSDDSTAYLASIIVPCIVGPLLIAILVYCIIKIHRKRDKAKIKTDILEDNTIPHVKPDSSKKS